MFAFGPNKKTPVVRVIGWGLYYHLRIRIHLGIPFQTKTNERADVFFSWLAWGALTSVLSSEGRFLRAALAAKLMAEAWEETIHLGEDLQGSAPGAATKGAATTGAAPHGGKWVVTHNESSPFSQGTLLTKCKDWKDWSATWCQKRVVVWYKVWSDSCMKSMRCIDHVGGSQTIFPSAPILCRLPGVNIMWCWLQLHRLLLDVLWSLEVPFGAWRFISVPTKGGGDTMASQCQSVFGHCMFLNLLPPAVSGGPKTSEESWKVSFGAISTFVFVFECLQWQTCNTMYLLDVS